MLHGQSVLLWKLARSMLPTGNETIAALLPILYYIAPRSHDLDDRVSKRTLQRFRANASHPPFLLEALSAAAASESISTLRPLYSMGALRRGGKYISSRYQEPSAVQAQTINFANHSADGGPRQRNTPTKAGKAWHASKSIRALPKSSESKHETQQRFEHAHGAWIFNTGRHGRQLSGEKASSQKRSLSSIMLWGLQQDLCFVLACLAEELTRMHQGDPDCTARYDIDCQTYWQ